MAAATACRWSYSGARLLTVAAKRLDLIAQQTRTQMIAARQCHRQGELELFQLMLSFDLSARLQMATGRRDLGASGGSLGSGPGMGRRGLLIGMQTVRESHG